MEMESWEILRREIEWTAVSEGLDKRVGLNGKTSQGKLLVMWLDHF